MEAKSENLNKGLVMASFMNSPSDVGISAPFRSPPAPCFNAAGDSVFACWASMFAMGPKAKLYSAWVKLNIDAGWVFCCESFEHESPLDVLPLSFLCAGLFRSELGLRKCAFCAFQVSLKFETQFKNISMIYGKIVRVDLKSYFGDKQSDKLLFLVDSLDS